MAHGMHPRVPRQPPNPPKAAVFLSFWLNEARFILLISKLQFKSHLKTAYILNNNNRIITKLVERYVFHK